jgi:hypothetical protein
MPQCGQDVGVDLAGKDHLCHFECGVVGNTAPFDNRLFDAELLCEVAQLLAAAVNDADANTDLVQEGQLLGERDQIFLILRDFAREFDDKRLSLEALDIRQRLAQ